MLQNVLPSTRLVNDSTKFVFINKSAVEKFCETFFLNRLNNSELGRYIEKWDIEKLINITCLFNCINFCFWASKSEKKWEVVVDGNIVDGADGLFLVLEEAVENSVPLFDAYFLTEINMEKLGEILKGNVEIPLLEERVKNLQEAGQILTKNFDGSFINIFKKAENDAVELTNLFIKFFPSFNDYAVVDGIKVEFYKRAQLNTDMINYRLMKKDEKELYNSDKLTAFADYKVPQVLRRLGILKYESTLAQMVDSYIEIRAGSREEVEIRAATVWAIENIKETLKPKYPNITSKELDDYLWDVGQTKLPDDKPYHRTRTIFY